MKTTRVEGAGGEDRQRIDRWLCNARFVRTRSAASALVSAGHVRLNGERSVSPGRLVRAGDVVTLALDRSVRVVRIVSLRERRGPPAAGRALYEDLGNSQQT